MAKQRVSLLVFSSLTFLAVGMLASSVGPVLPDLAANTGTSLETLGSLFSALFLGGLLSQLVAGALIDAFGRRPVMVAGLALLALGICGLALSPNLWVALASMLLAGLGDGALILAVNVAVAQVFASRNVAALNLLNVFFGVGAIAGPAVVGLLLFQIDTALPVLWTIGALCALLVLVAALAPVIPRVEPPQLSPLGGRAPLLRSPLLWVLSGLLLLYVGLEIGTGGWAAAYVERTTELGLEQASFVASGFWLALTLGRLAVAMTGVRIAPYMVLQLSLLVALAGGVLLALSVGQTVLTVASFLLIGFGLGPVYPTVAAVVTTQFSHSPGKALSVVAATGSLGGMLLPPLQGTLMLSLPPAVGAASLAAGLALTLALYLPARLLSARRHTTDRYR